MAALLHTYPTHEAAPERRISLRLMAYWEKLRGGALMPPADAVDADELADLWQDCFLVRLGDRHRADHDYLHIGSAIILACSEGLVGARTGRLVTLDSEKILAGYVRVCDTARPATDEGEFINNQGKVVKYRQCLLPFGLGRQVDTVLGGMRFKVF